MPTYSTRITPASFADLRTRIRRLVTDLESQRWSDDEVDNALLDSLSWMYNQASGHDGWGLQTVTMTYTNGSDSVALPAETLGLDIVRVEDTTNSDYPRRMEYTSLAGIQNQGYTDWEINEAGLSSLRYTFLDNAIMVRPKDRGDRTLTVYYVGGPYGVSATGTDTHAYPVHHEELICVGAANRLTSAFDETPMAMQLRQEKLEREYIQDIRRYEGTQRVRRTRRRIFL